MGPGLSSASSIETGVEAHNTFLKVLSENGWPAFLIYLIFQFGPYFFVKQGRLLSKKDKEFFAVCLSILFGIHVEGLVVSAHHWRHVYWILALLYFCIFRLRIKNNGDRCS